MKIELIAVVVAVFCVAVSVYVITDTTRNARSRRELLAHGIPGVATVVSAKETGGWVANQPVLALVLKIKQDQQPEREQKVEEVIPVTAAALFQPGAVMRVRIDPKNPERFVFDEPWTKTDGD